MATPVTIFNQIIEIIWNPSVGGLGYKLTSLFYEWESSSLLINDPHEHISNNQLQYKHVLLGAGCNNFNRQWNSEWKETTVVTSE